MPEAISPTPALWPLVVYFLSVLVVVAGMLGISYFLGQRHMEPATGIPFESGVLPTGSARRRISVSFYQVAIFFVVFDLEAVFLYAWAVSARELGWPGFVEIVVFVVVLLAALVYLWGQGALDWGGKQVREGRSQNPEVRGEITRRRDDAKNP